MVERSLYDVWSPLPLQMISLWRVRRGNRQMPTVKDFYPILNAPLFSHAMIIERHGNGFDYSYHQVGSAISACTGLNLEGRYFSQIDFGARTSYLKDLYARFFDEAVPRFGIEQSAWNNEHFSHCEWLALPLSHNGQQIDSVLGGFFPYNRTRLS
jgi:hypothetical protein